MPASRARGIDLKVANMPAKNRTNRSLQEQDRRSGEDRRRVDSGLPRKYDRRRGVEPRKPEVVEIEMSDSEFMVFGQLPDK